MGNNNTGTKVYQSIITDMLETLNKMILTPEKMVDKIFDLYTTTRILLHITVLEKNL